ncbi:hypothetical protein [Snuella lapsa]|uniref:Anti-sigma factor n=1 Tax=Snuella lapsa TaxID=870481 RepID=A0ABP6X757_9FLAO
MDPIKFDEHIKETLSNRKIKPSEAAWDKLSDCLETKGSRIDNRKAWLFAAASVIAIFLVTTQFFYNNTEAIEVLPLKEVVKPAIVGQGIKEVEELNEGINNTGVNKLIKNATAIEERVYESNTIIASEKKINVIEDKKRIELVTAVAVVDSLTFEEQKIKDLVAQIHTIKKENKEVSDDEIETLLKQAQKEIKLKRLQIKGSEKVDAIALLEDVEAELDQSFRAKVFEALKASYNSVKTAVAQRNN